MAQPARATVFLFLHHSERGDTMIPRPIKNDAEYRIVHDILTKQSRPLAVLKIFVNLFDAYRQQKKMGWSRPWNKVGTTVFASYVMDPVQDANIVRAAAAALESCWHNAAPELTAWVGGFFNEGRLKGYLFCHDRNENQEGQQQNYEGLTISLGRPSSHGSTCIDRLDIVLEQEVKQDVVTGVRRLTFIVDPFAHATLKTPYCVHTLGEEDVHAALLFQDAERLLKQCAADPDRVWQHWSQSLIHYFVDVRKKIPEGSLFAEDVVNAEAHIRSISTGSEQRL